MAISAVMDRINPVTLIAGAASAFGAARTRELARSSQGGLILAGGEEAALAAIADDLEAQSLAPERVSTLAFDLSDPERWAQVRDFLGAHYGRLDWAVICATAVPRPEQSDLVEFAADATPDLAMPAIAIEALAPLMRKNVHGGAVIVAAAAAGAPFAKFIHTAAELGVQDNIRVHGLALGGAHAPAWSWAPWLHDLVRETGNVRAALARLARAEAPMARCAPEEDLKRLVSLMLSDETNLSGAVLAVDAGHVL